MTPEIPQERPEITPRQIEVNNVHAQILNRLDALNAEIKKLHEENAVLRNQIDVMNAAKQRIERCGTVTSCAHMPHMRNGAVEYPALRETDLPRRVPSRLYVQRINNPQYAAHRIRGRVRGRARMICKTYEYRPCRKELVRREPEIGQTRNRWTKEKGSFTEQFMGKEQGWQTIAVIKTPEQHARERDERRSREAEEKAARRKRAYDSWATIREWDQNRNNPVWKERKNAERRLKAQFGEDVLKPVSAPDIAYRMHLARSGITRTEKNAQSVSIDSTTNTFVSRESRNAAELLSKIPRDYDRYGQIDERFGNIRDDVQRIREYHDKLVRDWNTLPPAERYYRTMRLRTLREGLSKVTRQHESQEANRDRLKYRFTLHTEEVPVPRIPDYAVRIMLPPGITSFDKGESREIIYYPYNNTFRGGDLAIANEAGLVFENAPAGEKDGLGRERVRGVFVHFKRDGVFTVNGKTVNVERSRDLDSYRDELGRPNDRIANPWNYRKDPTASSEVLRKNGRTG